MNELLEWLLGGFYVDFHLTQGLYEKVWIKNKENHYIWATVLMGQEPNELLYRKTQKGVNP